MARFDHVGMSVSAYEASLWFYTAALEPLGIRPVIDFDNDGGRVTGFAADQAPFFWVGDGGAQGGGFMSPSRSRPGRRSTPFMTPRCPTADSATARSG